MRGGENHLDLKRWAAAALMMLLIAGCQAMTGRTAGQNIDDVTVTASVKSRLVADKAANLTRVDVGTNNGVLSLSGIVESDQQKARAEQLARQVNGVRSVINNLQIQTGRKIEVGLLE